MRKAGVALRRVLGGSRAYAALCNGRGSTHPWDHCRAHLSRAAAPLRPPRRWTPASVRSKGALAAAGYEARLDPAYLTTLEASQECLALSEEQVSRLVLEYLSARQAAAQSEREARADEAGAGELEEAEPPAPMELLSRLRADPFQPVGEGDLRALLKRTIALLSRAPEALVDIEIPRRGARLVLVGDTHGQLADVLWLFHQHGPPSLQNIYLFNGDVCDRSPNAIEIWCLLFSFMQDCPGSVYVLRGNHEFAAMNERSFHLGGGFTAECQDKYAAADITAMFQQVFQHLPLFAMISREIFVVHGGLPRLPDVTLEDLRALEPNASDLPVQRSKKQRQTGVELSWSDEETILFDAMWADPHDGSGIIKAQRGGESVCFGEDVTKRFLDRNQLRLCIRGHELNSASGHKWAHDGRLLTIFSASNYAGAVHNNGSAAIITPIKAECAEDPRTLNVEVVEHQAPNLYALQDLFAATNGRGAALDKVRSQIPSASSTAARMPAAPAGGEPRVPQVLLDHVTSLLCACREEIWGFCHKQTRGSTPRVSAKALAAEISRLTLVGCTSEAAWYWVLQEGLDAVDKDDLVDYEKLLLRFKVDWPLLGSNRFEGAGTCMKRLMGAIISAELSFDEAVQLFDRDLSKTIDVQECQDTIANLLPSLTRRQVHTVVQSLQEAWGSDPQVSIARFMSVLAMDFACHMESPEPSTVQALSQLAGQLAPEASRGDRYALGEVLLTQFQLWDTDGNGLLSRDEILSELVGREIGEGLDLDEIIEFMDANLSGTVNVFEFLQAFCCVHEGSETASTRAAGFYADLVNELYAVLLTHRATLLRTCRAFDAGDQGTVTKDDFLAIVEALLHALRVTQQGRTLSVMSERSAELELSDLGDRLPDEVSYEDLLAGLRITEVTAPAQPL